MAAALLVMDVQVGLVVRRRAVGGEPDRPVTFSAMIMAF